MKELICENCGDTFMLDWGDKDTERKICRQCEDELYGEPIESLNPPHHD